ncbi:uridine kinase family protein [Bacillus sp. OTU530]|uniref:uridine kinase family protein n=1 Tax=Bacillus sp. OTU530 TaxID=3043862 RepID=UPI00406C46FC
MDFVSNNNQMCSFSELLDTIEKLPKKQETILVGIDGCGGSGKSTFANTLQTIKPAITIVHKDDFYFPSSQIIKGSPNSKPVGADFDWNRLLRQVIHPLSQNQDGYYQRYDWNVDELTEWHLVPIGGIVIIEGVYALRKELEHTYDFKIWVDCPREIRLTRGLERDGEEARDMWENNWMILEDIYVRQHKPHAKANLVINGTK